MYSVPMEIPKFCNKCPFGACNYNFPHSGSSVSMVDRKENRTGTYGYVCNLDFYKNNEYTQVLRADTGKDIKKPAWCGLKEITNPEAVLKNRGMPSVCEPEYLGENVAVGCRDGRCTCGNIVRSYQNFCDSCGSKLDWGNVHA